MTIEFDKDDWKDTKRKAKKFSIKYLVLKDRNLVIAYKPAIENDPNCRMLEVSVAWCAPEDKFKKKRGKYISTSKLLWIGEFIQLPLNHLDDTAIRGLLNNMFIDF